MNDDKHQAAQQRREAFERWYVENCPDIVAEPIGSRLFTLQWSAHTAGRDQGLREAAAKVRAILADCEARDIDDPELEQVAAAIEQLRGNA